MEELPYDPWTVEILQMSRSFPHKKASRFPYERWNPMQFILSCQVNALLGAHVNFPFNIYRQMEHLFPYLHFKLTQQPFLTNLKVVNFKTRKQGRSDNWMTIAYQEHQICPKLDHTRVPVQSPPTPQHTCNSSESLVVISHGSNSTAQIKTSKHGNDLMPFQTLSSSRSSSPIWCCKESHIILV